MHTCMCKSARSPPPKPGGSVSAGGSLTGGNSFSSATSISSVGALAAGARRAAGQLVHAGSGGGAEPPSPRAMSFGDGESGAVRISSRLSAGGGLNPGHSGPGACQSGLAWQGSGSPDRRGRTASLPVPVRAPSSDWVRASVGVNRGHLPPLAQRQGSTGPTLAASPVPGPSTLRIGSGSYAPLGLGRPPQVGSWTQGLPLGVAEEGASKDEGARGGTGPMGQRDSLQGRGLLREPVIGPLQVQPIQTAPGAAGDNVSAAGWLPCITCPEKMLSP
jgi:hypothetical protein